MSIRIIHGDCRTAMRELPEQSVHCVVTSPPYWGLRDYQVEGQIGLEASPDSYVAEMVAVFREVWRVLRDDGTCWLNLGDSYAASRSYQVSDNKNLVVGPTNHGGRARPPTGLKEKDLIGIPWRVAFALQADGWWLRQDNIWAKRNCMPESVRDRTTRAHEMVFMLTKSGSSTFWAHRERAGVREEPTPDYRWVNKITREETAVRPVGWPESGKDIWRRINFWTGWDYFYDAVAIEEEGDIPAGTRAAKGAAARSDLKHVNGRPPEYYEYTGKRNKRSVWHVATQPFAEAHFATMPPAIVETCVLAGSSERGCCAACGAPWTRMEERTGVPDPSMKGSTFDGGKTGQRDGGDRTQAGPRLLKVTTGWAPSCQCSGEPDVVPCTVLDPFGGAGTTGLVADRLGRNAILIELNGEYIDIARRRLTKDAGMFAQVT